MAMELPVVATSVSAEGIRSNSGEFFNGLYIANDAETYAKSIISLLKDYDLARQAGRKAREFIVENYSWEKNVGIMMNEYKKLLDHSS